MSNNLDITIHDFKNVCRTCLSRENLKPLYEKCSQLTCLVEMLMSCTFVKFVEDDGLPGKICTNCIDKINQAFSFAKDCEKTDTILRDCAKNFEPEPMESIKTQEEIKMEIQPEFILPDVDKTEKVLGEFERVEVKQEKDAEIEYVEVKQEPDIEKEYDTIYDDPADENYEEDVEKSDNIDSTNSQMNKESFPPESLYYECKKCFEKFQDFKDLKKHREDIKHPPNVYDPSPCTVCNKMIDYKYKKQHMRTHTGEKPYHCDICGASYGASANLRQHKRLRHPNCADEKIKLPTKRAKQIPSRDFKCTECERAFTSKILLRRHSQIHGEKKFICSVCERGFCRKSSLDNHMRLHTGVRPFSCDVCGKAFTLLNVLTVHQLTHTGEKPHVCSVCSKAFSHLSSLKYHMRIHTGEKPHTCSICSKAFTQSVHLKHHLRIHTGEKPYSCGDCGKSFYTKRSLTLHQRTHTGERPYVCSVCGKGFCEASSMRKHKRVHGEQDLVL